MKFTIKKWTEKGQKEGMTSEEAHTAAVNLSKLSKYAKREFGIEVQFAGKIDGIFYSEDDIININPSMSLKKQTAILLHECGHALLWRVLSPVQYKEKYGNGYNMHQNESLKKKFKHKCDVVSEEVEAWNLGWTLAKELEVRITREEFNKVRLNCLKSYFEWALE